MKKKAQPQIKAFDGNEVGGWLARFFSQRRGGVSAMRPALSSPGLAKTKARRSSP